MTNPEKAKEIISHLYSIRIHENIFSIVDRCIGKSRYEINNIVKDETKDDITEFGQGGLSTVIFVLVGDKADVFEGIMGKD